MVPSSGQNRTYWRTGIPSHPVEATVIPSSKMCMVARVRTGQVEPRRNGSIHCNPTEMERAPHPHPVEPHVQS